MFTDTPHTAENMEERKDSLEEKFMQIFLLAYLIVASIACAVTVVLLVVFALTPNKTEKAQRQTVVAPLSQTRERRRKTADYKHTQTATYTPQISARDQARLVFSAVLWGAVIPFTMFKVLNRSK